MAGLRVRIARARLILMSSRRYLNGAKNNWGGQTMNLARLRRPRMLCVNLAVLAGVSLSAQNAWAQG